tara:strand:+ start:750 stop:1013 length:264 start_codon:yes stop_codon:yes gene_type:complete
MEVEAKAEAPAADAEMPLPTAKPLTAEEREARAKRAAVRKASIDEANAVEAAKEAAAAANLVKDEIKAGKIKGLTAADFDLLCLAAA